MPQTELTGKSNDLLKIVLPAAARGDLESVRRFVQDDWKWIYKVGPHDRTMLWEACYRGRIDTVRYLIENGADVNAAGTYYTPLIVDLTPCCVAGRAKRDELAELLVSNGALIDIHSAAYLGDVRRVAAYLRNHPELINTFLPATVRRPMSRVATNHKLPKAIGDIFSTIEKAIEKSFAHDLAWAHSVLKSKDLAIREIRDAFAGIGTGFHSHILKIEQLIQDVIGEHFATKRTHAIRCTLLRGRRTWLDSWRRKVLPVGPYGTQRNTPLHYAVAGNQLAVVELLISHGADVATFGAKLLNWSEAESRKPIFELLLENGADVREAADAHWVMNPRLNAVAQQFGIQPNIDPLLINACSGNMNAPDHPERVQAILDKGANINARDYKGKTALHRASQAGFQKISEVLFAAGADIEARDNQGETPLFDAVRHDRIVTTRLLVSRGASPSAENNRGRSILKIARRSRKKDASKIVSTLLEKKC